MRTGKHAATYVQVSVIACPGAVRYGQDGLPIIAMAIALASVLALNPPRSS